MSFPIVNTISIITAIGQLVKEFIPYKNNKELSRIDEKFQDVIKELMTELEIISNEFNKVKIIAILALCFSGLSLIGIVILLIR